MRSPPRRRQAVQLVLDLLQASPPAHDAADPGGRPRGPGPLALQVLACPDGDGVVDATPIEQRAEVVGEEVALEGVDSPSAIQPYRASS